jgi:hypothetical protein
MTYTPNYSVPSGAKLLKTDPVGLQIGGKLVPGYQSTFSDGTSKWIYQGDTNLSSNFDYSTFTGTKTSDGKWTWSPTTSNSVQNLASRTGVSATQVTDSLYKTPQVQNVLNGNRVLQLGGIAESKKIEGGDTLPGAGGSVSNPDVPVDQTTPNVLDASTAFQEEFNKGFKKNTRENYQDAKYPLNLKLENQDCIKFSIVEYKAPGVKPGSSEAGSRIVALQNIKNEVRPGFKDRKILSTITLPIPGGISDRNPADWGGNIIDELQKGFADISLSAILGGGSGAADATQGQLSRVQADLKSVESGVASKFTELATGATNILSRQFGAVVNPNLELLFNGPSLRSFTFNFRFTPRESKEAEEVRKIIRQFKQAMSVKRSASSLLLRAPHTFAISYLSNNKDHPYLNRFKECALTDCSVSYTPDGTYMTYTDSSMTAYELSLTFQELEPIFDDDYFEIDENKDTSIGF